jgi:hypothetical protein
MSNLFRFEAFLPDSLKVNVRVLRHGTDLALGVPSCLLELRQSDCHLIRQEWRAASVSLL